MCTYDYVTEFNAEAVSLDTIMGNSPSEEKLPSLESLDDFGLDENFAIHQICSPPRNVETISSSPLKRAERWEETLQEIARQISPQDILESSWLHYDIYGERPTRLLYIDPQHRRYNQQEIDVGPLTDMNICWGLIADVFKHGYYLEETGHDSFSYFLDQAGMPSNHFGPKTPRL